MLERMRGLCHGAGCLAFGMMAGATGYLAWRMPLLLMLPKGQVLLATFVVVSLALLAVFLAVPRYYDNLALVVEDGGLRYPLQSVLPTSRPRQAFAAWEAVYLDGKRLLVGDRLIALRVPPYGALFEAEDLAAIAARLPEGHALASAALTLQAWKSGAMRKPMLMVVVGLVVGIAILELRKRLL